MPCLSNSADAAYFASRSMTQERIRATYPLERRPASADATDRDLAESAQRLAHILPTGSADTAVVADTDKLMRQKTLTNKLAEEVAKKISEEGDTLIRLNLTAQPAPGAGRWLHCAPRVDKPFPDDKFATAVAMRIGVDLEDDVDVCRFCGDAVMSKAFMI
jgi:hypothetical protein